MPPSLLWLYARTLPHGCSREWYVSMGRDAWQQHACSDGCGNAGTKGEAAPECMEELLVRPAPKAVHPEHVWHRGWGAGVQLKWVPPANSFVKTFFELEKKTKLFSLFPHVPFLMATKKCVSISLGPWEVLPLWQLCRRVWPIPILFHILKKCYLVYILFLMFVSLLYCFIFVSLAPW